jgi:hypothetical protein
MWTVRVSVTCGVLGGLSVPLCEVCFCSSTFVWSLVLVDVGCVVSELNWLLDKWAGRVWAGLIWLWELYVAGFCETILNEI